MRESVLMWMCDQVNEKVRDKRKINWETVKKSVRNTENEERGNERARERFGGIFSSSDIHPAQGPEPHPIYY